ncbi:hypothetical protein AWJ14_04045 [Hoeflea olei]|uniref:Uncharacterized protein n=1 Tax=Hoeflea olei TaxID=1480615 RepID=A0A1C1YX25_9HYPH|nr:hypothetical protein AWJ14_04045 [Hoeflea olei]
MSAHPAPGAAIDGLLVIDHARNLEAVDAREFRYHRREIALSNLGFAGEVPALARQADIPLYVYEARTEHPPVEGPCAILRSYLDAVMQGFLHEFGEAGLHRFVDETEAFDMPIHEDRHAPVYARAVTLTPAEVVLFDAALSSRQAARKS